MWPCPFHQLTGLWCPACGGTRMVAALIHGDVGRAWAQNPLLLLLALATLVVAVAYAAGAGERVRRTLTGRRALIGVLAVVTAFTVARNLPGIAWLGPV